MKKKLVMSVELTVDVNDGRKSLILHTNSIVKSVTYIQHCSIAWGQGCYSYNSSTVIGLLKHSFLTMLFVGTIMYYNNEVDIETPKTILVTY